VAKNKISASGITTIKNATKPLRLKGSQSSVFHIFPSVDAWNIGGGGNKVRAHEFHEFTLIKV